MRVSASSAPHFFRCYFSHRFGHRISNDFGQQKSVKMALEIAHRTGIDCNTEFRPFWGRFLDPFGVHFGSFGLQKGANELDFSMFGIRLAQFLVPMRLGSPTRSHFGTILAAFWNHFWKKTRTGTRPYTPTAQRSNKLTALRPSKPATSHSNNPITQKINTPC